LQPPVYNAGDYPAINEARWNKCREDGMSLVDIKRKEQQKKEEIDMRLRKYILPENKPASEKYKHKHLNVVLVGWSGRGISATGNTLLGKQAFTVGSRTQTIQEEVLQVNGRTIR
jgi:predicted GTPase